MLATGGEEEQAVNRQQLRSCIATGVLSALAMFQLAAPAALAGYVPINDLASELYLDQYQGGLYPDGSNLAPAEHALAGLARAGQVRPRNPAGDLDLNGHYVLLSIGLSNTTQEFSTFQQQAAGDPRVNHTTLAIVDGAKGGQAAGSWTSPLNQNYDRIRDDVLAPQGLTEQQVQAAWVKVANPSPNKSLPLSDADAFRLVSQMGDITRALKTRYSNLQLVFISSRIYAGYAQTALNPEPYAYESGFAVKWMVEAQIDQMDTGQTDPLAGDLNYQTVAPWAGWGPYLWADGLNPRSDGLIWEPNDFAADGTHPSQSGRQKVSAALMDFMLTSPFAKPWFALPAPGDMDGDGLLTGDDINPFVLALTDPNAYFEQHGRDPNAPGDCDDDGLLTSDDVGPFTQLIIGGSSGPSVPEPAALSLLAVGALVPMLSGLKRKRKS